MTRLSRATLTARAAALLEAWRAMGEPNVGQSKPERRE